MANFSATFSNSASLSGYLRGGADGTFAGQIIKSTYLPDQSMNGFNPNTGPGRAYCVQQSEQILCKGPDGGLHWYKVVGASSDGGNIVLEFVGP